MRLRENVRLAWVELTLDAANDPVTLGNFHVPLKGFYEGVEIAVPIGGVTEFKNLDMGP